MNDEITRFRANMQSLRTLLASPNPPSTEALPEVQEPVLEQKPRPWVIYVLADPRTNEIRYVGKTHQPVSSRVASHIRDSIKRPSCHRHYWLNSLTRDGVKPSAFVIDSGSSDDWGDVESSWINFYRGVGFDLVNTTSGGQGAPGVKQSADHVAKRTAWMHGRYVSPETREKQAAAKRGRKLSDENRRKIAEANIGRHVSDETINKIKTSRMSRPGGYKHSDATKLKMAESMKNRKYINHNGILCVDTGEVFNNAADIGRMIGRSAGSVREKLKRKSPINGMVFKYLMEDV